MKFYIGIREVHVSTVVVEAESKEQAIIKAKEGNCHEVMCEYSHTLDSNTWSVEASDE